MSTHLFEDLENQISKVKKELNNLELMFSELKKNYKQPVIEKKTKINSATQHYKINVSISKSLSELLGCSQKLSSILLTKHLSLYIKTNENDLSLKLSFQILSSVISSKLFYAYDL